MSIRRVYIYSVREGTDCKSFIHVFFSQVWGKEEKNSLYLCVLPKLGLMRGENRLQELYFCVLQLGVGKEEKNSERTACICVFFQSWGLMRGRTGCKVQKFNLTRLQCQHLLTVCVLLGDNGGLASLSSKSLEEAPTSLPAVPYSLHSCLHRLLIHLIHQT